jgi:hypothetical protein
MEEMPSLEGPRPRTSKGRRYFGENTLRHIRRAHPDLVDAQTATWEMSDQRVRFAYERELKAR